MARETAAEKAEREAAEAAALNEATSDVEPVEGGKVRVPQDDGEIVLSKGGDVVRSLKVSDGLVSPRDDDERALLLAVVPGAKLA